MEAASEVNMSTAVAPHKQGFFACLLGQFASRDFWRDLFSMIVREAVSSFISVLGGTLIYAVQQRATEQSSSIRKIAGVGGPGAPAQASQPSSSPGAAFSNGYTPAPSYRPSAPAGAVPSYPGFG